MDFNRLEYIKNVTVIYEEDWAYQDAIKNSEFQLVFRRQNTEEKRIKSNALKLPKGSLIILSQRFKKNHQRYLTHIVELISEGHEDQQDWNTAYEWGTFRCVKVHWVANFNNISSIPLDKEVMQVEDWGYQNTLAKSLEGNSLMKQWGNIDNLRKHLESVFQPLLS